MVPKINQKKLFYFILDFIKIINNKKKVIHIYKTSQMFSKTEASMRNCVS